MEELEKSTEKEITNPTVTLPAPTDQLQSPTDPLQSCNPWMSLPIPKKDH